MGSPVKVLHAPHTGVTVPSLDRAVRLFRDVLHLPVQRTAHLAPPIAAVVGHPAADIDIALIELPGGHLLELLEYAVPPAAAMKPLPWQVGSWHLCLTVAALDDTIAALVDADAQWTPMAATQQLTTGPNAGRRLVYMRHAGDGLTLELFE